VCICAYAYECAWACVGACVSTCMNVCVSAATDVVDDSDVVLMLVFLMQLTLFVAAALGCNIANNDVVSAVVAVVVSAGALT